MPPAYVTPYVKRGKTDAADAAAICEAVTRPTMRFVPVKSREQQAALSVHRARHLLVKQRTQLVNMMRGLLAEFGIDIPQGLERALLMARQVVDGETPDVPPEAAGAVDMLAQQALATHAQLREIDRALAPQPGPTTWPGASPPSPASARSVRRRWPPPSPIPASSAPGDSSRHGSG
jgi:transposase